MTTIEAGEVDTLEDSLAARDEIRRWVNDYRRDVGLPERDYAHVRCGEHMKEDK